MERGRVFKWLSGQKWLHGRIRQLTTVLGMAGLVGAAFGQMQVYVATNGKDTWSGSLPAPNGNNTDGPKKTLEGARDKLRLLRNANQFPAAGVVINVMPGVYPRSGTFQLGPTDGGSANGWVIYKSATPKAAVLEGGLPVTGWQPVAANVRVRLKANVRNLVRQVNLRALNINEYGTIKKRRFGEFGAPTQMELFYNDLPMQLAKFPNSGWARTSAVQNGRSFKAQGGLPIRAWPTTDVWYHGFPIYNYAEEWGKVSSVGFDSNWTSLVDNPKFGITTNARFQLVNVLTALDAPGEYYIDRSAGMLYFYAPGGSPSGRAVVSMLETPILATYQTNFVKFQGFTIANSRGDGLYFDHGSDLSVVNCTFKNLGGSGMSTKAQRTLLHGNDLVDIGQSAIVVSVGDRVTLASGEATLTNNWVERPGRIVYSGAPAISLNGVGILAQHNLVRKAPYQAFKFSGNNIIMMNNEVAFACMETGDDGAFYSGRDFTYRGNVIEHNLIRDVKALQVPTPQDGSTKVNGIFLDDFLSGTMIRSNAFVRCDVGVQIGGGRDNSVRSNVFYACNIAILADSRGETNSQGAMSQGSELLANLVAMPYNHPPYSTLWPELATLMGDTPLVAKRNNVKVNVNEGGGAWLTTDGHYSMILNPVLQNRVNQNVGFISPSGYNFDAPNNTGLLADGYEAPDAITAGLFIDQYRSFIPGR